MARMVMARACLSCFRPLQMYDEATRCLPGGVGEFSAAAAYLGRRSSGVVRSSDSWLVVSEYVQYTDLAASLQKQFERDMAEIMNRCVIILGTLYVGLLIG